MEHPPKNGLKYLFCPNFFAFLGALNLERSMFPTTVKPGSLTAFKINSIFHGFNFKNLFFSREECRRWHLVSPVTCSAFQLDPIKPKHVTVFWWGNSENSFAFISLLIFACLSKGYQPCNTTNILGAKSPRESSRVDVWFLLLFFLTPKAERGKKES